MFDQKFLCNGIRIFFIKQFSILGAFEVKLEKAETTLLHETHQTHCSQILELKICKDSQKIFTIHEDYTVVVSHINFEFKKLKIEMIG